jgi:hypothetical protein
MSAFRGEAEGNPDIGLSFGSDPCETSAFIIFAMKLIAEPHSTDRKSLL